MTAAPPTMAELATLLRRYFIGATDDDAKRLLAEVTAVLSDPGRHAAEAIAFDPRNGRKCYGLAWREELAFDHADPTPLELAAWLASRELPGFPPARPYCPDVLVGTWTQLAPVRSPAPRWEIKVDGTFICDEPVLRRRQAWRVHRMNASYIGDSIWLDDDLQIAHKTLAIAAATPDELVLEEPGTDIVYKLRRT